MGTIRFGQTTSKTIAKLMKRNLIAWQDGGCWIVNPEALAELAGWTAGSSVKRPFP